MNKLINSSSDSKEAVTYHPEAYVYDNNSIVKLKIDVAFKKLFGSPENIHILDEFLTEKFAIHFYELNKLPPQSADNSDDPVLQWLWLINSETREELEMLTNSNIPEIRDAVKVVSYFSKDEQMRINAFEREMAVLDRAAELAAAKKIR